MTVLYFLCGLCAYVHFVDVEEKDKWSRFLKLVMWCVFWPGCLWYVFLKMADKNDSNQ